MNIETEQLKAVGEEMFQLMTELFPICRSITGNGVRKTHQTLAQHVPLQTFEVPTGTQVFDWNVPKEWNIKDAYIIDPEGNKIVDFQQSNVHVVNYSIPVRKKISLEELKPHLHTLPEQPDIIPYLTTYYKETWGFCLPHHQYLQLKPGTYEVVIDSTLQDGSLTYSEAYIQGRKQDEVLISCYTCHPSLCNDNLSGVVLTTFLAKHLIQFSLNYSYRFLFIPETIGAITWLAQNEDNVGRIKHGLVATCLGDAGRSTYKKSRQGDAEIDKAACHVLKHSNSDYKIVDFFPWGSDERQFCSPGFNLPVGSLMRTAYPEFPEYHTSADNLDFMSTDALADTFLKYLNIVQILEKNNYYQNLNPKCEPQLGKRGLYQLLGSQKAQQSMKLAIFWALSLSDGQHSLLDIAEKANLPFALIESATQQLVEHHLLQQVA